jgi:lysozyme family protein
MSDMLGQLIAVLAATGAAVVAYRWYRGAPVLPSAESPFGEAPPLKADQTMPALYAKIMADHAAKIPQAASTDEHAAQREDFRRRALKNEARYRQVSLITGFPWRLIAAIHERESSGLFDRYLHNGQELGKPTTAVPKDKLFYDWESAAVDALKMFESLRQQLRIQTDTSDLPPLLTFAEQYNGLGYRNKGQISPYIYSGTTLYKGGKITSDGGPIDSSVKDKQLGVLEMLRALE